ncbi:hypothetical protein [Ktedonospora formicarum]|uniref:hypothetical protein n=1 Tax=Ktedonospora formicarum TaxID=2778364 RepID=UPI001C68E2E4|nr:hypothetical protein [Ktedonospora formicarum]
MMLPNEAGTSTTESRCPRPIGLRHRLSSPSHAWETHLGDPPEDRCDVEIQLVVPQCQRLQLFLMLRVRGRLHFPEVALKSQFSAPLEELCLFQRVELTRQSAGLHVQPVELAIHRVSAMGSVPQSQHEVFFCQPETPTVSFKQLPLGLPPSQPFHYHSNPFSGSASKYREVVALLRLPPCFNKRREPEQKSQVPSV